MKSLSEASCCTSGRFQDQRLPNLSEVCELLRTLKYSQCFHYTISIYRSLSLSLPLFFDFFPTIHSQYQSEHVLFAPTLVGWNHNSAGQYPHIFWHPHIAEPPTRSPLVTHTVPRKQRSSLAVYHPSKFAKTPIKVS